jgi:hypothetical protein
MAALTNGIRKRLNSIHDDINDNVYIIMEEREREDRKKRDRVKEREVLKNDFF